jgi:hypothetical protein
MPEEQSMLWGPDVPERSVRRGQRLHTERIALRHRESGRMLLSVLHEHRRRRAPVCVLPLTQAQGAAVARIDVAGRRLLRARDAMDRSYANPLDVPARTRWAGARI